MFEKGPKPIFGHYPKGKSPGNENEVSVDFGDDSSFEQNQVYKISLSAVFALAVPVLGALVCSIDNIGLAGTRDMLIALFLGVGAMMVIVPVAYSIIAGITTGIVDKMME